MHDLALTVWPLLNVWPLILGWCSLHPEHLLENQCAIGVGWHRPDCNQMSRSTLCIKALHCLTCSSTACTLHHMRLAIDGEVLARIYILLIEVDIIIAWLLLPHGHSPQDICHAAHQEILMYSWSRTQHAQLCSMSTVTAPVRCLKEPLCKCLRGVMSWRSLTLCRPDGMQLKTCCCGKR